MLLGSVYPTKGRVSVSEDVTPLLELGSGFHPDLTGRENIFLNGVLLGLPIAEVEVHLEKIVAFAEIGDFLDMPLRTYSSGMQFRLAFSIAVNSQPRLLLIDEVLAVGDEAFQMKCKHAINWFLEHGVTIILVTHNMSAVKDICSRAIWLDGGEIKKDGKPEMVVEEYLSHL
jgi:ABC-type polysaccharide/polyol phosphate transport system ATPase subunit